LNLSKYPDEHLNLDNKSNNRGKSKLKKLIDQWLIDKKDKFHNQLSLFLESIDLQFQKEKKNKNPKISEE